jgi:hypothetical protein
MRDVITRKARNLNNSVVMETIKERLIEKRFNIDRYERANGLIEARRNNLYMILTGLYRKVGIQVEMNEKSERIKIYLKWSGFFSSSTITFVEVFLISMLVLRDSGLSGVLGAVLIGMFFSFLNLVLFSILRNKLHTEIKRDIWDLERSGKD